jgi:hypothetical protein
MSCCREPAENSYPASMFAGPVILAHGISPVIRQRRIMPGSAKPFEFHEAVAVPCMNIATSSDLHHRAMMRTRRRLLR